MKILIIGGAGFIGSNFVHLIVKERPDWEIVNFDLLTYAGNLENLASVAEHLGYRFAQGDLADAAAVKKVMSEFRPDLVINFAAETHVDRSIHLGAGSFVRTNIMGVQVLLDALRETPVKKFVQVSTDEVFGALVLNDTKKFVETTPLGPNSPYAASKAGGDLMVRAYFKTYGLPVIVTHASNNYGPCQFPEKLIPYFITRAMAGETLPLYGDGRYVRDWLHVEDHCRALLLILERGVAGETYNIGADAEKANIEVAKLILKEFGQPESKLVFVADRPGHDRRYAISSKKLHDELGWQPTFGVENFENGLRATIQWYRENIGWCERLKACGEAINTHIKI